MELVNLELSNKWLEKELEDLGLEKENYLAKNSRMLDGVEDLDKRATVLSQNALENVAEDEPNWTFLASRIYLQQLYRQSLENRGESSSSGYGNLYKLIKSLVLDGVYSSYLLEEYTREEIYELEKHIDPSRDRLFNYLGLKTLVDRYLVRTTKKEIMELPQERWMVIAMTLNRKEKENRLEKVKESYWAMSNLYMTVATPTLANSGRPKRQLSSCFIDMPEDNLDSIYLTDQDFANVSKYGGGMGVYMGKVRSRGSSIQNVKGMSSGVLPWIN